MAKFTRKKPKKPSKYITVKGGLFGRDKRKRKSPGLYLQQMENYIERLKDYNAAKKAHDTKKKENPSAKKWAQVDKLEQQAQKLR